MSEQASLSGESILEFEDSTPTEMQSATHDTNHDDDAAAHKVQ